MKIDKLLEFDKVKEKWMELALTDSARKHIADITYYLLKLPTPTWCAEP